MTTTTALVYWLRADPAVAALVGARVYQQIPTQSPTYPFVVLQTVSRPLIYHLRGEGGIVTTRVQVDSYAQEQTGLDAKALVDEVAAAVDARLSGRVFVQGTVYVRACLCSDRIDTFERLELHAYRVLLDYYVWSTHKE
jgi:Protein of unknown function (DUF3168)